VFKYKEAIENTNLDGGTVTQAVLQQIEVAKNLLVEEGPQ